ncbi:MAG TPA: cyclic beta 1-2 glucan synthetase, partial [Myxococcota bacterium]
PVAACANLRRLEHEGRLTSFGFYEAIDYTPARLPPGKTSVTVRSFMAHHQGMSLLSLAYALLDRPMQRRFLADPEMRATELLLQERVPKTLPIHPHPAEVSSRAGSTVVAAGARHHGTPHTPRPEVQLLSNGRYHVVVSSAGGGASRFGDLAVTRWREDPTRDAHGTFIYVKDVDSGDVWSAGHQPTLQPAKHYEAIFSSGRAELRRVDDDVETHVEIAVSPEDDVELRRVSFTNRGTRARTLQVTSYAEVVLAPAAADAAHQAFSNLFVQTELLREASAILATRRPRSGNEQPPTLLHLLSVHGRAATTTSFETNREAFVGRGRTTIDPRALEVERLGDSEGAVLDPIVAVRTTIAVPPGETVRLHLVTGVAATRAGAVGLVDKYRDRHVAERVLELSWTDNQVALRRLDTTDADVQLYERLASHVLYASAALRAPEAVLLKNRRGQSGLWGYGISGDLPIVLVRIGDLAEVGLVHHLLKAHAWWRLKGLIVDVVIWNEDPSGYRQVLQETIMGLVTAVGDGALVDVPGGVFVRRGDQISDEDKVLMQAAARLVVTDTAGPLAEQLEREPQRPLPPIVFPSRPRRASIPAITTTSGSTTRATPRPSNLRSDNGHGGFAADGHEYVITTSTRSPTPAPWVNVIANPWFGTVVSERGSAYTWCENAHGNRLTPWSNDPVSDGSGEHCWLRDEDDGSVWSPTPQPAADDAPYTTRHGFGYSVFEHVGGDGIASSLSTYVATDAPLKFIVVTLKNDSGRARRLSLTTCFDLVMGAQRAANAPHIGTSVDVKSGALLATNPWNSDFAARVTFLDCSESVRAVSGDRAEILGRNGDPARPATLLRERLSGRVGGGLDPCLAMQVVVALAPGEEREVVFTFGSGRDRDDAITLIHRFRGTAAARTALEQVWNSWNRTLGAVNVQTPDAGLDALANGWLLYQVLSSRLWARSGFYQSGGAFGFRDQLQDAMALVHAEPALLREQILRCASRQFREGDVQHWWHPPQGRGVRTRISDDYLWLPLATARYVDALGDDGVLDEKVAFLEGRAVKAEEDSYSDLPMISGDVGTLYEHGVRAIEHGLRFGAHGLPLMGTGDWNDGMNLVGDHGRGESVWLGMFLVEVLRRFAPLARRRDDVAFADRCDQQATTLRDNIVTQAWDGSWYKRAWFDDGTPLGAQTSNECTIDSLPQSWAVLADIGPPERRQQALAAAEARLVRRDLGVIQLFDPPFDGAGPEPGYIRGYVPGVRENGGQYTHAAVWMVMAFAEAGEIEKAWDLFDLINPIRHGDSAAAIATYKIEPYVVAADVYTNPDHAGRGGWSWYTGSASWMYRLVIESLLGVRLAVDRLHLTPKLRAAWPELRVHYRHHDTVHHIHVLRRGVGDTVTRVVCDGVEQADRSIPLQRDRREHHVVVELG